jgi:hypothetical protein
MIIAHVEAGSIAYTAGCQVVDVVKTLQPIDIAPGEGEQEEKFLSPTTYQVTKLSYGDAMKILQLRATKWRMTVNRGAQLHLRFVSGQNKFPMQTMLSWDHFMQMTDFGSATNVALREDKTSWIQPATSFTTRDIVTTFCGVLAKKRVRAIGCLSTT